MICSKSQCAYFLRNTDEVSLGSVYEVEHLGELLALKIYHPEAVGPYKLVGIVGKLLVISNGINKSPHIVWPMYIASKALIGDWTQSLAPSIVLLYPYTTWIIAQRYIISSAVTGDRRYV